MGQRLGQLAATYGLPDAASEQLEVVLSELARAQVAVSAVREPERAVDVHVADSLAALEVGEVRTAAAIADLGSGGGFPGLALAVALPDAHVALVESVGKKCEFLERVVAAAGIENVSVVHARAEEWAAGVTRQDLVTARALAGLPTLVEYAAPLLREGGSLVAWKGEPEPQEEADGAAAADVLGMEPRGFVATTPFRGGGERRLYVYLKVGPTPGRYPRRAGMARKRPLGAST